MQVSATKIAGETQKKINQNFLKLLTNLRSEKDAETFFQDFFTETEKIVLVKRFAVALLLHQGFSYEEIQKQLKVSTATISVVAESLEKPGFQLAFQKFADEQWADETVEKIWQLFSPQKS